MVTAELCPSGKSATLQHSSQGHGYGWETDGHIGGHQWLVTAISLECYMCTIYVIHSFSFERPYLELSLHYKEGQ